MRGGGGDPRGGSIVVAYFFYSGHKSCSFLAIGFSLLRAKLQVAEGKTLVLVSFLASFKPLPLGKS